MSIAIDYFHKQRDNRKELQDLLDKLERSYGKDFLRTVLAAKEEANISEITRQVQRGDLSQYSGELERRYSEFTNSVTAGLIEAGEITAAHAGQLANTFIVLNVASDQVLNAVSNNNLRLITNLRDEQRRVISDVLIRGITEGTNPRVQATEIRDSIGLTENQQQWVTNYRRNLENGELQALNRELRDRRFDPTVARAITGEQALTSDQIDRMVERYAERVLSYRAEVIARTEALRSVNEGSELAFQQAVDEGLLNPEQLVRRWVTARDNRVRESHASMNGQEVGFGEAFLSGNGNTLRYPGDSNAPGEDTINCRCVVTTRIG